MPSRNSLIIAGLAVLSFASLGEAQTKTEKVAARVAEILNPTTIANPQGFTTAGKPRTLPRWLEHPEPGLSLAESTPPLAPLPTTRPTRPRLSPEPTPLLMVLGDAETPQAIVLPAGELIKQHSVDALVVIPLPILGQYAKDRVSLLDPSMEASVGAIMEPQTPERVNLVPFQPWNLPDPFEYVAVIRLKTPWAESPEPPLFTTPPTSR